MAGVSRIKKRDPNARHKPELGRSAEDWRSSAQTDMDRIWYASEFRRLEGVTQVVPPQDDYVFHDRLTHSMKVAQVAATLARKIRNQAAKDPLKAELAASGLLIKDWVDPDHCYAAGLAHDIGHPPYGHAGEQALQEIQKVQPPLESRSFEGNAQSTRIVASLSFRKAESDDGLNLTLRTLAAIAKYPWGHLKHPYAIDKLKKKWSFYPEEAHILQKLEAYGFIKTVSEPVPGSTGTERATRVKSVQRWPEAEIMDWADDISYAVHDVEDFFRAGRIPLHRIAAALNRADKSWYESMKESNEPSAVAQQWLTTDFSFTDDDEEIQRALWFARSKMEKQVAVDGSSLREFVPAAFVDIHEFLLWRIPTNRFDGSRAAHTALQSFGSGAISYLSSKSNVEILDPGTSEARVAFRVQPVAQLVAEFFKAMCQFFVINTSALRTLQYGQQLSLTRLVEATKLLAIDWLEHGSDEGDNSLPSRLREYLTLAANRGPLSAEAIGVAVVDFVCSLRDAQAMNLESRLFGQTSALGISESWLDG